MIKLELLLETIPLYKLLVLDKTAWNYITVCHYVIMIKLELLLETIPLYKLLVLDKTAWNYITVCHYVIMIKLELLLETIPLYKLLVLSKNTCFNQTGNISTLNSNSQKLVDKFTYLGSSVSSTETDINPQLTKAWIAIGYMEVRPDR